MPRVKIPMEPYKDKIIEWRLQGTTREDILQRLKTEDGLTVSLGLLKRQLAGWDCSRQNRNVSHQGGAEIREKVIHYFQHNHTDKGISALLEKDGFSVSVQTVGNVRRDLGLLKRRGTKRKCTPSSDDEREDELQPLGFRLIDEDLLAYARQPESNTQHSSTYPHHLPPMDGPPQPSGSVPRNPYSVA